MWFDRELDCTALTEGYGYLSVPAETVEVQTAEVTDRPSVAQLNYTTEPPEKVCTWLQEISSCSCLTFLSGPAWLLLNKTCILFPGPPYTVYKIQKHKVSSNPPVLRRLAYLRYTNVPSQFLDSATNEHESPVSCLRHNLDSRPR